MNLVGLMDVMHALKDPAPQSSSKTQHDELVAALLAFLRRMGDDSEEQLEDLLEQAQDEPGTVGDKIAAAIQFYHFEHRLPDDIAAPLQNNFKQSGIGEVGKLLLGAGVAAIIVPQSVRFITKLSNTLPAELKKSTRHMIGRSVDYGRKVGATPKEITRRVRTGYTFSPERAKAITITETTRAASAGKIAVWTASKKIKQKQWMIESANPCDVCIGNEADGPIGLEEAFSSGHSFPPVHGNCACDVEAVT